MNLVARASRLLPNWSIVMGLSGLVGATSAIVAVVAYRKVLQDDPVPLPVESETTN